MAIQREAVLCWSTQAKGFARLRSKDGRLNSQMANSRGGQSWRRFSCAKPVIQNRHQCETWVYRRLGCLVPIGCLKWLATRKHPRQLIRMQQHRSFCLFSFAAACCCRFQLAALIADIQLYKIYQYKSIKIFLGARSNARFRFTCKSSPRPNLSRCLRVPKYLDHVEYVNLHHTLPSQAFQFHTMTSITSRGQS